MKKEYIGKTISDVLENMINERESILAGKTPERHVELTNGESKPDVPQVITPILCGGDAIGSVILSGKDRSVKMGETETHLRNVRQDLWEDKWNSKGEGTGKILCLLLWRRETN